MAHPLPAIDADGHIVERQSDVRKYLPEPWNRRPTSLWTAGDQPWDTSLFETLGGERNHGAMSPEQELDTWLRIMDEAGIETAVLFPTGSGNISKVRERDFAVAAARAANTLFAKEYATHSPRLKPVGVLPLQDPAKAVEEMRFAVEELGLISFEILSLGLPYGLGDPYYEPIWAEAQRLGVPLCVHGNRNTASEVGGTKLNTFAEVHAYTFPAGIMLHFTSILCQGIPVRYPCVKIAFLEIGATWLPYYLDRLDEHWELRGQWEMPHLPKKPSQIFKESPIFVSLEAEEGLLPETLDYVGDDHFLYASDIPHWDMGFPNNLNDLRDHPRLSREAKEKILYRNAQTLFGLAQPAATATA